MGIKYSDFVDYSKLDPIKKLALEKFAETMRNPERLGIRVVPESLGEPAAVLDFTNYDFMLAVNIEGLGTKNLVADKMTISEKVNGSKFYQGLGIDTIAMSANDLVSVGADPFVYVDTIESGDSKWFDNLKRSEELLEGFKIGAQVSSLAIPQGETPTLKDIINPNTVSLAGASVGLIRPKSRFTYGQKLKEGDFIFGLESNGIHSNGLTLARKIVEKLPDKYDTKLSTGGKIGSELLKPTRIYARPIMDMFDNDIDIHYLSPITGHGWKKIMRARKKFTYLVENVPDPPELFTKLQEFGRKHGFDTSDFEAYQTWNMRVGYVIIAPSEEEEKIMGTTESHDIKSFYLGYVKKGDKQVIIKPKDITYVD